MLSIVLKEKKCKNCKYGWNLCSERYSCSKVKHKEVRNSFTGKIDQKLEFYNSDKLNSEGKCLFYKEKTIVKIFKFIFKRGE